jgi:hypothetical protein
MVVVVDYGVPGECAGNSETPFGSFKLKGERLRGDQSLGREGFHREEVMEVVLQASSSNSVTIIDLGDKEQGFSHPHHSTTALRTRNESSIYTGNVSHRPYLHPGISNGHCDRWALSGTSLKVLSPIGTG